MFPNQMDMSGCSELPIGPGAYVQPIIKSYVPGKGFIKATQLGSKGLRNAAAARKMPVRSFRQQNAHVINNIAGNKKLADKLTAAAAKPTIVKGKRGGITRLTTTSSAFTNAQAHGAEGIAFHTGGRRGQRMYVAVSNSKPALAAHEMQHLAPKRSSWRYNQVLADPKKHMAEEARADVLAGNHFRRNAPRMSSAYHAAMSMPAMHSVMSGVGVPRAAAVHTAKGKLNKGAYMKRMYSKDSLQQGRDIQDRVVPKYRRKGQLNKLMGPRKTDGGFTFNW